MRLLRLCCFALVFSSARPAFADEAGDILTALDDVIASLGQDYPSIILSHDAPLLVPAGDGYRLTLPALAFAERIGGENAVIGDVAVTVTPFADGTYLLEDLSLPSRLAILDADGKVTGELAVNLGHFSAVWWPLIQTFRSADIRVDGVTLFDIDDQASFNISAIAYDLESSAKAGLWDQVQRFEVTGFDLGAPDLTLSIEKISGFGTVFGMDADGYAAYSALAKELGLALGAGDLEKAAELKQRLGQMPTPLSAFAQRISFDGWRFIDPLSGESADLAGLSFGMDFRQLDRPLSSAKFLFEGHGLALAKSENLPLFWRQLIPTDWRLPIVWTNLPTEAVTRGLLDFFIAGLSFLPGEGADMDFLFTDAFGDLLPALQKAGTVLSFPGLSLKTPLGEQRMEGEISFSENAENGFVGALDFILRGLEEAIAMSRAEELDDGERMILGLMQMFLGTSQRLAGPNGEPLFRYLLEFPPTGSFFLNKIPLQDLFGGLQP